MKNILNYFTNFIKNNRINSRGGIPPAALRGLGLGVMAVGIGVSMYTSYHNSPVYNPTKRAVAISRNLNVNADTFDVNDPLSLQLSKAEASAKNANLANFKNSREASRMSFNQQGDNASQSAAEVAASEGQKFDEARMAMEKAESDRLEAIQNANLRGAKGSLGADGIATNAVADNTAQGVRSSAVNSSTGSASASGGGSASGGASSLNKLQTSRGKTFGGSSSKGSSGNGNYSNTLGNSSTMGDNSTQLLAVASKEGGRAGSVGGHNVANRGGRAGGVGGSFRSNTIEEANFAYSMSTSALNTSQSAGSKKLATASKQAAAAFDGGQESGGIDLQGMGITQPGTPEIRAGSDDIGAKIKSSFKPLQLRIQSKDSLKKSIWSKILAALLATLIAIPAIVAGAKAGGWWGYIAAGVATAGALATIWLTGIPKQIKELTTLMKEDGEATGWTNIMFYGILALLTAGLGLAWYFGERANAKVAAAEEYINDPANAGKTPEELKQGATDAVAKEMHGGNTSSRASKFMDRNWDNLGPQITAASNQPAPSIDISDPLPKVDTSKIATPQAEVQNKSGLLSGNSTGASNTIGDPLPQVDTSKIPTPQATVQNKISIGGSGNSTAGATSTPSIGGETQSMGDAFKENLESQAINKGVSQGTNALQNLATGSDSSSAADAASNLGNNAAQTPTGSEGSSGRSISDLTGGTSRADNAAALQAGQGPQANNMPDNLTTNAQGPDGEQIGEGVKEKLGIEGESGTDNAPNLKDVDGE